MLMQLSHRDGKAIIRDRGETLPPAPNQGFEVSAQYLFSMLPTASTNKRHRRLYRFFGFTCSFLMRMQLSQRDGKAIIRDRGETLPPAPSQGFEVSAQY